MSDNPIFSERTRQALKGKRPYIPTDEECLRNEKVRALVEAYKQTRDDICELAEYVLQRKGPGLSDYEAKGIFADLQRARLRLDAALAAMQEVK